MEVLIVIPVYNEEKIIKENLNKLLTYLEDNLNNYNYKVVVANNRSSDQTAQKVNDLTTQTNKLSHIFYEEKGKGLAVLRTWQKYQDNFEIFIFMDADLATDLTNLPHLIKEVESGNDIAIGSRYHCQSIVKRSLTRKIFSQIYSFLTKLILDLKISDLPCGFKAVNKKVVKELVPIINNQTWFFDSELLYLASKKGYKIKEIPIKWTELRKEKSNVNLFKVSFLYLKEILKLKFRKI